MLSWHALGRGPVPWSVSSLKHHPNLVLPVLPHHMPQRRVLDQHQGSELWVVQLPEGAVPYEPDLIPIASLFFVLGLSVMVFICIVDR